MEYEQVGLCAILGIAPPSQRTKSTNLYALHLNAVYKKRHFRRYS